MRIYGNLLQAAAAHLWVCGKRFYEPDFIFPKYYRITARVFAECVQKFKHKQPQKDIARELDVSPSTVGRWLHFIPSSGADKLPKVLPIDEFKGNTEYGKFQAILTDSVKKGG